MTDHASENSVKVNMPAAAAGPAIKPYTEHLICEKCHLKHLNNSNNGQLRSTNRGVHDDLCDKCGNHLIPSETEKLQSTLSADYFEKAEAMKLNQLSTSTTARVGNMRGTKRKRDDLFYFADDRDDLDVDLDRYRHTLRRYLQSSNLIEH